MKQPDDKKTLELMLEEGAKRGRGRPAKADAMTGAERAKKFRDAKRAAEALNPKNKCDVTKNTDGQALMDLTRERDSLAEMVRELEEKIREISRDLDYKTRSLMAAHSELRTLTEKFEAQGKTSKRKTRSS